MSRRISVKKQKRKRQLRRRIIFLTGFLLVAGIMIFMHQKTQLAFSNSYFKNVKQSEMWRSVFAEPQNYPDNMLEAVKKNPEILEFVAEYPNAKPCVKGGITAKEETQKNPLFLQWDDRWGYVPYGDGVIGITGCAPTCLSMVIISLTGDVSATPDVLAQKAMELGAYVDGAGTAWSFMEDAVADYGIKVSRYGYLTQIEMEEMLDEGKQIILSMGPGEFTSSGHFILVCGHTEKGFVVNDPFSKIRSKIEWDYNTLSNQWVGIWVYE